MAGQHGKNYDRWSCIWVLVSVVVLAGVVSGCGAGGMAPASRVVLTTGFGSDEVFRIEGISATLPELMVYLTNMQNQYEQVFGQEIWDMDFQGETLKENVKETALARIAQIKTMNLLAVQHGVALDDAQKESVKQAASSYIGSLSVQEVESMRITQETIVTLYSEYALANKIYEEIIKDSNPEISDDEARTVTVSQIFVKAYTQNALGERIPYTEKSREEARRKARDLRIQIDNGADFAAMVELYNEAPESRLAVGKGDFPPVIEEAVFALGGGEISGLVETDEGFYIFECISTFDKEETAANKLKIIERRKKEVFNQEYEAFTATLTKNLNQELWEGVTFIHDEKIDTADFFDTYELFFSK